MRPWQMYLAIVIVGLAALTSGWHPLYLIFWVLVLTALGSALLSVWGSRGLAFARTLPGGRAQMGEVLEERLRLENRSHLPKLWVQVTDHSTLPGHHAGYVASMGGRKRIDWRVRTTCTQRGRFYLGPVTATIGDPMGIYTRTLPLASQRELIVLPQILPIKGFNLFPGAMPGRGRGSQRSLQTTTNAVTVREYLPGDALSRIHWPTSARTNKLMVKEFDLDPTIDVWVVLDLDDRFQRGRGKESTEEYGVTIAATLANYFLYTDLSLGLIVNDGHDSLLQIDRGVRQLDRALEILAVTNAGNTPPLAEILNLHETKFMRNSALVLITASPETTWAVGLRQLERRGVHASVILLDGASFGTARSLDDATEFLIGAGVPILTVHQGQAIAETLETGIEVRQQH
jgi:uncharacterized protein (DUF58 family)